jgi:hypothetical protein
MQFNKLYQENFFFFTTYINEEISKNVVKFKNIAIIYNNKYIDNEKKNCDLRKIKTKQKYLNRLRIFDVRFLFCKFHTPLLRTYD